MKNASPNRLPNKRADREPYQFNRRQFLTTALKAGALLAAPQVVPGRPGQGRRRGPQRADRAGRHRHRQPRLLRPGLLPAGAGRAVRGHLRREGRAPRGRQEDGRCQVRQPGLRHVSRSARAAGPQRHRRRADRHRPELARHGLDPGGQRRQGRLLREALHEEHRAEPGAGRDVPPHRPRLPGRHAAAQPAQFRLRHRAGPPRQARQAPDAPRPSGRAGHRHERLAAAPNPSRPRSRWTGTCTSAPPPGGPSTRGCSTASTSRKAAAWSAAAAWNGARIAWTSASGPTTPTTPPRSSTSRKDGQLHARYANGVKLVMRNDGWLPLGSCPVRFEGDTGWVETGDNGDIVASSPALLAGKRRQDRRLPGQLPRPRLPRLREDRAARPAPTPTRPATRTSPVTRPTSPSS